MHIPGPVAWPASPVCHPCVYPRGTAPVRCLQVSYAIGVAKPLSINVETYGTGTKSEEELVKIVEDNFDLRPGE